MGGNYWLPFLFSLLLFSLFHHEAAGMVLPDSGFDGSDPLPTTPCKNCHPQVFNSIDNRPYQHFSSIKERCSLCHFKRFVRTVAVKAYAREHLVMLDELEGPYAYDTEITVTDRQRNKQVAKLAIVPSLAADLAENPKSRPSFKRVEIEAVERGIFASAVISWQTDRWSRGVINYGEGRMLDYSATVDNFSKEHHISLEGLSVNRPYYFRITAVDVFGNQVISQHFSFTPTKPFRTHPVHTGNGGPISVKTVRVPSRSQPGSKIAVICSSDREISLTVQYSRQSIRDQKHFGMETTNLMEAGMQSCLLCHSKNVSHPVGEKITNIPEALPTYQKILICATCHLPHGSDMTYLARFDLSMELCVKCHPKKHG